MRLRAPRRLALASALLGLVAETPRPAHAERKPARDDQKLFHLIERENQLANLLSSGKLAYDAGDDSTAVARWEALLKLDGVPADVQAAVRPLLSAARARSGKAEPATLEPPPDRVPAAEPARPAKPASVALAGTVSGGGASGPGGAVVTLHRTDGPTPRPAPLSKPLLQKDKKFVPHVVAVPVGSEVDFRNEDDLFHNVFSISSAAPFDTGLRKGGAETRVKFEKPGVVQLFCNIHAAMLGYLLVVDTPWFAVADGDGAFQIKGLPPGEYDLEVWHENAAQPTRRHLALTEASTRLSLAVAGDKRLSQFPPDKYGKPRQQQLGY